jgi:hypothetical protein
MSEEKMNPGSVSDDIVEQRPSIPNEGSVPGWIKVKKNGELKAPCRTFLRLMFSDDNLMPSSSRVIGTSIFAFLLSAMTAFTWVVVSKIYGSNDANVIIALVGAFRYIFWFFMFLAASALSMYGIHVWKYMAQIQMGLTGTQGNPWSPNSYNSYGNSYGGSYGNLGGSSPYTTFMQGGLSSSPLIRTSTPLVKGTDPTPVPDPPPTTKTPIAGIGSDD